MGFAQGEFYATGYVPVCLARMRAGGADISEAIFAEGPMTSATYTVSVPSAEDE